MRMTDLSMERNLLYNVGQAEERLQRLQDMASSGKNFAKPQDDPVGVQRSMTVRNEMTKNSQYLSNLGRAKSFLGYTEEALSELSSTLSRAHELGLEGINGTNPQAAKDAIAAEVQQLVQEVQTLSDRTMEGRPVLTGTMPTWRVGAGVTMTSDDLSGLLKEAEDWLKSLEDGLRGVGSPPPDPSVALTQIETVIDKVLSQRATNGARVSRLETLESQMTSLDIEYKKLLSDVEDADLTQVIVKLKSAEVAYQAALGAGARLIQPSLLDYLK